MLIHNLIREFRFGFWSLKMFFFSERLLGNLFGSAKIYDGMNLDRTMKSYPQQNFWVLALEMLINLVPHTSKHLHVLKLHNHPIPMTVATHLHSNLFHWHFKCRFNAPNDLRFVGLWLIRSGFDSSRDKKYLLSMFLELQVIFLTHQSEIKTIIKILCTFKKSQLPWNNFPDPINIVVGSLCVYECLLVDAREFNCEHKIAVVFDVNLSLFLWMTFAFAEIRVRVWRMRVRFFRRNIQANILWHPD